MKGDISVLCVKMILSPRCELTISDISSPSSMISVVIENLLERALTI